MSSNTFVRPPDAPVFTPTEEEFASPLLYIQSIKQEAEKYGICKIIPPKSFKPPFAVNKETFRFKARYQRLSDLDGFSRSRHSFNCMLRRFWLDQGWPADMTFQSVGDRIVDWYDLYIAVFRLGGFREVTARPDGWANVARILKISTTNAPNATKDLKTMYEKNLLPYDDFRSSVEIFLGKDHAAESLRKHPPANKSAGCRRLEIKSENADTNPSIKDELGTTNPNMCKMESNGSGMSTPPSSPSKSGGESGNSEKQRTRTTPRRSASQVCYSEMICEICKHTGDFDNLKFCEKCETTYHLKCIPPGIRKDKGKLFLCPRCMKETFENLRACHTFGFETSSALYSLDEFQRKATEFKRNHFGSLNVSLQAVEQEFWRLLADPLGETVVEYGADLHRGELGSSGFPTDNDRPYLREAEKEYIDHPWNLNKLPDNDLSILKHITAQISGMKIPWMYVGMVFSAFCWHTEDHWSASINYLHMGEPKTWYGVPGSSAEAFETAFKQLVPILMESNPDLLHQLVTHMNPTVLNNCGVPVYRMDQRAGEFIVTFPRAYHAGFNQGFNFAEAVNFCLADWIPHGRLSINHYSNCKRELVFSHDELICCMADQANMLHQSIAKGCYADFLHMVEEESANRQRLIDVGIVLDDEPTLFEFMDDHERSCSTCHTTLFLSAVQCACSNEKLACGKHAEQLCSCAMENRRLLYRYSIDDLNLLLEKLHRRSEEEEVVDAKPAATSATNNISKRAAIMAEARMGKRLKASASDTAMDFFGDYEASGNNELKAAMKMASELVSPQTITRGRDAGEISPAVKRWKLEDVEGLVGTLSAFPGTSKEVAHIREYVRKYTTLCGEIRHVLQQKPEELEYEYVKRIYDQARSTNIFMENLEDMQKLVLQTEFRERISVALNDPRSTIDTLAEILQSIDEIYASNDYVSELFNCITSLIDEGRNLEMDAENIVHNGHKITLSEAKDLIERTENFPVELKNIDLLRDGLDTIEKLVQLLETCQKNSQRVHMSQLKTLFGEEHPLNIQSGCVGTILEMYARATKFVERMQKLFLGKVKSPGELTLLEVLTPRQVNITHNNPDNTEANDEERNHNKIDMKCHPFELDLAQHYDSQALKMLFQRACWEEQNFYEHLRETNCLKSALDSDTREESVQLRRELRWCVCGGIMLGRMIQCESCFDWFHASCTRMGDLIFCDEGQGELSLITQLVETIQFMCGICQRGLRPSLESVEKIFQEYRDLQRFIIIPEMDLTELVISRAEKWRRSAANIITELAAIVHRLNTMTDREKESHLRCQTRDSILAVLLEGNLLEVKLPEWLFLYDFMHENFRKDKPEDEPAGSLVLPTRTHGKFPIAVDQISPLFRQLAKGLNNKGNDDVPSVVEPVAEPQEAMGRRRRVKKNLDLDYVEAKRPGRKAAKDLPIIKTLPPVKTKRRRRNPLGAPGDPFDYNYNGVIEEDSPKTEACYMCNGRFSQEQLLSTLQTGKIVPVCFVCMDRKNGEMMQRTQISESEEPRGRTSPRRNRPKPDYGQSF